MTAIQYCINANQCPAVEHTIVDRIRKALRQQSLIPVVCSMNTCIQLKRVNIGKDRVEKVLAQPWFLPLVERKAIEQILLGLLEKLDPHCV